MWRNISIAMVYVWLYACPHFTAFANMMVLLWAWNKEPESSPSTSNSIGGAAAKWAPARFVPFRRKNWMEKNHDALEQQRSSPPPPPTYTAQFFYGTNNKEQETTQAYLTDLCCMQQRAPSIFSVLLLPSIINSNLKLGEVLLNIYILHT